MLLNAVYAYHVGAIQDSESREAYDDSLYAPLAGWDEVERRMYRRMAELAEQGGGGQ